MLGNVMKMDVSNLTSFPIKSIEIIYETQHDEEQIAYKFQY